MSEPALSLQTHAPVPTLPAPLSTNREVRIRERWDYWLPQCILLSHRARNFADVERIAGLRLLHYSRIRVCYDRNIPLAEIRRANLDSPLISQSEFILALARTMERRACRQGALYFRRSNKEPHADLT